MSDKILEGWPLIYESELIIFNRTARIGVACMWSKKDDIKQILLERRLDKHINILGNSYSINAVIGMIINIVSNRHIRHLIITGEVLCYQNIVERIIEVFASPVINTQYMDLYLEYLPEIREQIKTCAYVKITNIVSYIKKLPTVKHYDKPPINIKDKLTIVKESDFYPSNVSGYSVSSFDGNIFNAFLDILRIIMTRGYLVECNDSETREILNLTVVLHNLNTSTICSIPYTTPSLITQYKKDILNPIVNKNVSYTYGSLLAKKTSYLLNLLKKDSLTRQAYICIFNEEHYALCDDKGDLKDNAKSGYIGGVTPMINVTEKGTPPCAVSIFVRIVKNILHMTATFRSNDMVKAWALNVVAFRTYQEMLCKELNTNIGVLTTIAFSAHIYKDDFNLANTLLKTHSLLKSNSIPENEGYYVISILDSLDDKIKVVLFSNDHAFIKEWIDSDHERLIYEVTTHINNPMHAAYVTRTIMEKKRDMVVK